MAVNIPVVQSTTPLTTEPVVAKVYDTWFLEDFHLYANADRTFNAKVLWRLGRVNADGTSELSSQKGFTVIEDLLSEAALTENPEIAAVVPQFLSALEAVSRRKGAIK
jgi:hypothetical protein